MSSISYQAVLATELKARRERNEKYSLRSFSRDLGIFPSQLSRVLRGEANFTVNTGKKIAAKLFSDRRRREAFLSLVIAAQPGHESDMDLLPAAGEAFAPELAGAISETQLAALDSWYHFAIMESLTLAKPPRSAKETALMFGITTATAQRALDTLEKNGFIRSENGRYVKVRAKLQSTNGVPSLAVRRYHKNMMERAARALDTQPIDRRYFFGRSVAVKKSQYADLVAATNAYMDRVSDLAQSAGDDATILYQINVQLFDLMDGEPK